MTTDFWQQQSDKPLFPNMLWSRPETKSGAGKLLIIGGQAQEFIHVAESFACVEQAGAGTVRVLMPESTRKLTKMLPNIEYATSNVSGSFAQNALAELLDAALWADGVLLAGDLGKNSETNLMLESFTTGYSGTLVIAGAAVTSIPVSANELFKKPSAILVLSFDELQKLSKVLGLATPITSSIAIPAFAGILHEITTKFPVTLVIHKENEVWTSYNGRVAFTHLKDTKTNSRLASYTAVWSIQNPTKLFEAVTTAVYC